MRLIDDRYDRQKGISWWDQEKLGQANITVIGAGPLAQSVILPLTAVGVKNLRIIGSYHANAESFLDFELNGPVALQLEGLEGVLREINPDIDALGMRSDIVNYSSLYFLENSDIIIDATNNPRSKALVLEYCKDTGTPYLSVGCDECFGRLVRLGTTENDVKLVMPDLKDKKQDIIISQIMGGLTSYEVIRQLMTKDELLEVALYYNLTNPKRFSFEKGCPLDDSVDDFSDKKVLVVGVGALGSFIVPGLANLGVGRIDIVDFDIVEETNLNRQIIYYDSVGKYKAEALADKIRNVTRRKIDINAIMSPFDAEMATALLEGVEKYDLVIDCVDKWQAREALNDYAINSSTPLISGGTGVETGQVIVYVPGKTSTPAYFMRTHENAEREREEELETVGCLDETKVPSVIMPNYIISGLMLSNVRSVFSPEKYGDPINGIEKYGDPVARISMYIEQEVVEI